MYIMTLYALNDISIGEKVRLVSINGNDRLLTRRLISLGLPLGSEVEILHHRGRGVVVAKQGNRIALGASIAEKVQTSKIDE